MTTHDGIRVKFGPLTATPAEASLSYNEFIVYDASRIRIRYLVMLESLPKKENEEDMDEGDDGDEDKEEDGK